MYFENPDAVQEPLLSIIIPTRNRASLFERSLKSILDEVEADFPLAEVIVVDGGSTDGTLEVLKREQHRLACWLSEPDSGVADATNKGARLARAEVLRFIGDDDELIPGQLSVMMHAVNRLPEHAVVAGHNDLFEEELDGSSKHVPQARFVGEVSRHDLYRWGLRHGILIPEVSYIRKEAFEKMGGFDLKLKWWGFLDLFLRMANANMRFFVLPIPIMKTYQHLLSDTRSNNSNRQFFAEHDCVLRWHTPFIVRALNSLREGQALGQLARRLMKSLGAFTGVHPRKFLARSRSKPPLS